GIGGPGGQPAPRKNGAVGRPWRGSLTKPAGREYPHKLPGTAVPGGAAEGQAMPRVLVVEDSPTQAEELRLLLEEGGFTVELARDAEAGLEKVAAAPPDLGLSDIVMPGLSGYDLCPRRR